MTCTHKNVMTIARPAESHKEGAVCPECVAMGSDWVHLRICRTCGHVGCCDDSPNRHARKHWEASEHPIISSMEPKEIWSYCFVDDETVK